MGKMVGGVFVWPKWSCIDFGNFVFLEVFKPTECGHSGFMAQGLACLDLFHCVMFVLHVFFLLSQENQNRVIWLQKRVCCSHFSLFAVVAYIFHVPLSLLQ